jgi:multidrug efflux pump subunit AcrA (membrane-fusion protein)
MNGAPGSGPAAVVGALGSEPRLDARFSASTGEAGGSTDFWSRLVNAETSGQLCEAWLGILCQWIPGTQAGLLLLHESGNNFAPAAVWPDPEREMEFMAAVAQQALVERKGVVKDESSGLSQCAYPLLSADEAFGVVVLHVATRGQGGLRDALRILHWGAGWLVGLFDKRRLVERDDRLQRSALLQDLVLGALAEQQPDEAGRWIVNRLAEGLSCRHVMLARAKPGGMVRIDNVSGTSAFEPRANLMVAAREALRDCVAQAQVQRHPPQEYAPGEAAAPLLAATSLGDYAAESQATVVLALPLVHQGRTLAALLLDFDRPVDAGTQSFAGTLALALAPALALQIQATRSLGSHAGARAASSWRMLVGPRHPGLKLAGVVAALLLVAAAAVDVDFRVRAPATVEGRVQRAAVAPFDGFIAESRVRAGDLVHAGDVLARLDDRELQLELGKAQAEAELIDRRLREAMAKGDAVAARIGQAEADQARATLGLARERLARVAVTAPFDGRVVKGDLTQQLGAPVEMGRILFEVAPLDAWRVVLKVDERDIAYLKDAQAGEMLLAALPGQRFVLRVNKVSPIALAEDGHNSFRVEAQVQAQADSGAADAAARIQPGMEGAGKVLVGQHSLLWIAFHRLTDWLRYTAWTLGL